MKFPKAISGLLVFFSYEWIKSTKFYFLYICLFFLSIVSEIQPSILKLCN